MRKITHTIKEYFELNQLRKCAHWRLFDGQLMFEYNGQGIDGDKFDEVFPQYDYKPFNDKGANPGKTYA